MPDPVWYRSLYWRIALGFVALLATLLVVQGLIFLWMTGRMTDFFPNRSPAQFAATLAADVSATLADRPDTDISTYLNSRYSRSSRGFVIAFLDRPTVSSERVPPPPMLGRAAYGRLVDPNSSGRRPGGRGGGGPGGGRDGGFGGGQGPPRGAAPGFDPGPGRGRGRDGPFGPGGNGIEFAPVSVNGSVIGMVAVPLEPPPLSMALRDLGPTLAAVAAILLAAGTAVSALVIFRPARRRLRELQEAARAIGAGDIGFRAPESGGDEVSALARGFNEMASQLEQRTLALEHANRVRRQLLADVSHELTTPLAAIRGYVETLQMPDLGINDAARTRYLGIVNEETERLEHLIGDLLDLARLEGGGGTMRVDQVSIDQLLERVRNRHEKTLADKGLTLDASRDAGADVVDGDANRLEQAVQNLVANAIRHTPPGGAITVRATSDVDRIVLTVEDTGPGIPPDHLARVFDRFYKIDESRAGTETPSGSGLGLSIVRAIVTRHGGTISVSNIPGAGARFAIVLPKARRA